MTTDEHVVMRQQECVLRTERSRNNTRAGHHTTGKPTTASANMYRQRRGDSAVRTKKGRPSTFFFQAHSNSKVPPNELTSATAAAAAVEGRPLLQDRARSVTDT
jgi:hypothetical protein